ncbi:MAG: universal stress protein [Xanthomonadaceae bacterium]|jgi:nucleotide-binding universal stress UspA family protein|nr:universal stress protein [Xanthomonadaceae bacterium]
MSTSIYQEGYVLAAVDDSPYAESVAGYAGWAASRLHAPLQLLHTLNPDSVGTNRDLSGNPIDCPASDTGLALLERLRGNARKLYGIEAGTTQHYGTLLDTLQALEPQMRLLAIGKRGEDSNPSDHQLGSNLERIIRAVRRPVLVTSGPLLPVRRFLIAYDGGSAGQQCLDGVCAGAFFEGMECHLLMATEPSNKHQAQLEKAANRLRQAGFEPSTEIICGAPEVVIAQHINSREIDMLVMGSYGHSRIRNLFVGSTTTHVLLNCPKPVLML